MKLKSWLKELPYTLLQGSLETEVDEVVYDSRKAAPGTRWSARKSTSQTRV